MVNLQTLVIYQANRLPLVRNKKIISPIRSISLT